MNKLNLLLVDFYVNHETGCPRKPGIALGALLLTLIETSSKNIFIMHQLSVRGLECQRQLLVPE